MIRGFSSSRESLDALSRLEGLDPATPAKLASAGGAQVADPLGVPARCDEIALTREIQDVDGNRAPLSAGPTSHGKRRSDAKPHQHGIDDATDQPTGLQSVARHSQPVARPPPRSSALLRRLGHEAAELGTTFVPLQIGHFGFAFSRSEMVMLTSKGFLHFSQRNS
jgi:hypothetical protein